MPWNVNLVDTSSRASALNGLSRDGIKIIKYLNCYYVLATGSLWVSRGIPRAMIPLTCQLTTAWGNLVSLPVLGTGDFGSNPGAVPIMDGVR